MVALEEVGDFVLAGFGVSHVARGGGAAKLELVLLCEAGLGTLERVEQLIEGVVSVKALHFY